MDTPRYVVTMAVWEVGEDGCLLDEVFFAVTPRAAPEWDSLAGYIEVYIDEADYQIGKHPQCSYRYPENEPKPRYPHPIQDWMVS